MTVKEQLIKEIERTPDDRLWQQVLDFAVFLRTKNGESVVNQESTTKDYQPTTELGQNLWAIRQRAIASGQVKQLTSWDDVSQEIAVRRRENNG